MRSFIDLIVIALATNQIVEIWRHSLMFQHLRYCLQVVQNDVLDRPTWSTKIFIWPTYVMLCNWCLSVWVALILVLIIPYTSGYMIALAFATSRVANLLNDVAYSYLRTPRYDSEPLHYPSSSTGLFPPPVSANRNEQIQPPVEDGSIDRSPT